MTRLASSLLALVALLGLPFVAAAEDPAPAANAPAAGSTAAENAQADNAQSDNTPPEGFVALFNGKDLTGWRGLVGIDPVKRTKIPADELAERQRQIDELLPKHWTVEDGVLVFDGTRIKGQNLNLCTEQDFGDFELLIDWKISPTADSGIYLRSCPQVQIWDPAYRPDRQAVGSGGLDNNKVHPSKPLVCADRPAGEWNTFRIRMVGEKVTIHLNDTLVVDDVVLENYWLRESSTEENGPVFERGPLELQEHGGKLYFKNIYIREL